LGVPMEAYGKIAVMNKAVDFRFTPSFNKYSGVAEWTNCLMLWVNIAANDSGGQGVYNNDFSEEGRLIQWYGGSRMHEDSPIVQRLIKAGGGGTSKDAVLLFVRLEGQNYVCFGRVQHSQYDLQRDPISIQWRLQDYDRLKNTPMFKEVYKTATKRR